MKNLFKRLLISALLCATVASYACTGNSSQTDAQTDYVREEYTDMSQTVQQDADGTLDSLKVTSEGQNEQAGMNLEFKDGSQYFKLEDLGISIIHTSTQCDKCGYVEHNGRNAYYICDNSENQGGMLISLFSPIKASTVKSMTVTYMTTGETNLTELRVLNKTSTNNAAFVNKCPSLAGAVSDWKTVDLGISDFTKIADDDGYIRAFKFYSRDKDNVEFYINSIYIGTDISGIQNVNAISDTVISQKQAMEKTASAMAAILTSSDLKADITLSAVSYTASTADAEGQLVVNANVKCGSEEYNFENITVALPKVSGVWLGNGTGEFAAQHDSKDQWKTTFDKAGIVTLTDNTITVADGLKDVQYAVVGSDVDYKSSDIVWNAPQSVKVSEGGFTDLYINAFADYGTELVSGTPYNFLVRGVSNNGNYILHLYIPFTYEPLSQDAVTAITQAYDALNAVKELAFDTQASDKQAHTESLLASVVNNESILCNAKYISNGASSVRMSFAVAYNADIDTARLGGYTVGGETKKNFYAFTGKAFSNDEFVVKITGASSNISLTAPGDGQKDIVITAQCIVEHMNAPMRVITNANMSKYSANEVCTPLPILFKWDDASKADGKKYTLLISESTDMSDPMKFRTTETEQQVYNLKVGQQYYWQVSADGEESDIFGFTTKGGYPRFIKADNISNFRDIGGYKTADGKTVKQGMLYRAAQLEDASKEGKKVIVEQLKIKTDLDLRNNTGASPIPGLSYKSLTFGWYQHIFTDQYKNEVAKEMKILADESNYPILFHCSLGRDRTGTTAILILGLCGVDEETILKEYYTSFFSRQGGYTADMLYAQGLNLQWLMEGFDKYEGDTLQARITAYLFDLGVTQAEIDAIKSIILE